MTRDISGRSPTPVFSALRGRYSLSRHDLAKSAGLAAAAVVVGVVAWNGNPLLLPVAMFFPALWAIAPNRMSAVLVSAGYFLAASRGLPQGVVNFYGSGMGAGLALWVAASAGFVIVHAALWTSRPGWGRAVRYGVAASLISVPPFGIAGWAQPITAAGIVFPGWGWWGLGAAAIVMVTMMTRRWPIAAAVLGGLWVWSATAWTHPSLPEGWAGVDTAYGGTHRQYADHAQHLDTIRLARATAADGAKVIVLPESAGWIWTPTVERLWLRALEGFDVTVNLGAIVVDHHGYDNVMIELDGAKTRTLYRERMPVPVSMWRPWQNLTEEEGGARAHFFANPVAESAGLRIAPVICYEQLLIWPILQSALHSPDVIVATGNGWWTEGTSIVAIQKAAVVAWAKLFDLPLVLAFND